jgi:hypothetical protein
MSLRTIVNSSASVAAVAALGTAGLLASPIAHADSCTVNGGFIVLHQINGFDITVSANGATLGPGARVNEGHDVGPGGSVNGSVTGRTIDFT